MDTRRHELRSVPGYELLERQSLTSAGRRCLAREAATAALVELHLVPAAGDAQFRRSAHERVARLAGASSPHLVAVRRLLEVDDALVLVTDAPPRTTLEELTRRRKLTAGEVVTLAVAVAAALSVLHELGLPHGSVSPESVRLNRAGRPVLAAAATLVGGQGMLESPWRDPWQGATMQSTAAADVYALAALCLTGAIDSAVPRRSDIPAELPAALVEALSAVTACEPGERPSASELALVLPATAAPEPIRMGPVAQRLAGSQNLGSGVGSGSGAADGAELASAVQRPRTTGGRRASSRRRAPRARDGLRAHPVPRTAVPPVVALLAGIAAVAAGAAYSARSAAPVAPAGQGAHTTHAGALPRSGAGDTEPSVRAQGSRTAGAVDWRAVLSDLDSRRAAAYAAGEARDLAEIYTVGSPAARRDLSAFEGVRARGLRAIGMRQVLVDVAAVKEVPHGTSVEIVDRMPVVQLVDGAGKVRERRPARGARRWQVSLQRHGPAWRIVDVVRG